MISILAVGGHCLVYQQGQIRNQAPRTVQNTQIFYSIPFGSSHCTVIVVEKKVQGQTIKTRGTSILLNQVHLKQGSLNIDRAFVSAARNNDIWV